MPTRLTNGIEDQDTLSSNPVPRGLQDKTLYLPAGPQFRIEREIKNVITVLAKTHHYWQEHIAG